MPRLFLKAPDLGRRIRPSLTADNLIPRGEAILHRRIGHGRELGRKAIDLSIGDERAEKQRVDHCFNS